MSAVKTPPKLRAAQERAAKACTLAGLPEVELYQDKDWEQLEYDSMPVGWLLTHPGAERFIRGAWTWGYVKLGGEYWKVFVLDGELYKGKLSGKPASGHELEVND